jgi:Cu/Ag efflux protein CusF
VLLLTRTDLASKRLLFLTTAFALLSGASSARAQNGSPDPVFAKYPLNEWLRSGERSPIRWAPQVSPARLSNHQRLMVQMGIQLDGAELADRPGKGRLLMLVQITGSEGRLWQNHGQIDFDKVAEGARSQYLIYTFSAFVLPGDYRVALAVVDTVNGERGVREERLHVPPLRNDSLPDAWRGLPPVEFLSKADPPDSWYLPYISTPLHLPLRTRRPVRIDVLVNLTPSERATGSLRAQSGNLSVLLPALKTISQLDLHNASLHIALLDLLHQRVTFHQDDVHTLDWPAMKDTLSEKDTGTIDLKSLGERSRNAAFFVAEVGKRIAAAGEGQARALVVLSSSVEFEAGEDLHPIEAAPTPDRRVFYIRYHALLPRPDRPAGMAHGGHGHMGMGGMGSGPGEWRRGGYRGQEMQIDQLEPTLKPLAPRLFDVEGPEDFRKALAAILAEIARM